MNGKKGALLLALAVCMAFSACGGSPSDSSESLSDSVNSFLESSESGESSSLQEESSLSSLFSGELEVTLSETSVELFVGETFTLVASINDPSAKITWGTSSRAVAGVEADGNSAVITANGEGTAQIRVRYNEKLMVKCEVKVTLPPEKLSVLVPSGKLILSAGQKATVKAIKDASLSGEAVWSSSDVSIASIEYQGLIAVVTAASAGECTVTVSLGGESSEFVVVVGKE